MDEVESGWRQVQQNGETQVLRRHPQDLQEQLLCLHAHRHLVSRGVFLKGINHCFHLLPGAFTSEALQLQYLIITRASKEALEELPEWKAIFDQWVALKYALDVPDGKFLMAVASLNGLRSPQMLVVFMDCIAEALAQMVVRRHVKLAEIEQLNFKDKTSLKVAFSISNLIAFLNLLLPHVLFNTIVSRAHLPLPLADRQQLECMYSNREMEFIVKQCPQFTTLLRVIFGVVVARLGEVGPMEQRMLMLAAFRFYYLHQQVKGSGAVEVLVNCFNSISESVRFALTEEFLLFLHVVRKLGRERLVALLLDKSAWLRDIDNKTTSNKIVGYTLEALDPFGSCLPERIQIQRGSSAIRYLQCIDDHSLVFLRVGVEDLDITIRITLSGDHLSKEPVGFIPLMFEKVKGQVSRTLIFPRRGVYCIKFDNTYSWLNAKTITYERIILSPLSYASNQSFPFRNAYYIHTPMNTVATHKLISIDFKISSKVHIHKREGFFIFSIQEVGKELHYYETDSFPRFITKLQQLAASGHPYHFWFEGQKVETVSGVQQLLKKSGVRRREKEEIIEMIALKY